jgi:NhaP-type Na+/H+ or K+/H+ antiporter
VVSVLYPLLSQFGYGLDLKESGILIWSGLRGAVALSLSMSVKVRTNYFIGLSAYL